MLALALLVDVSIGDPSNRFHLTAWVGRVIAYLKSRFKSADWRVEKLHGILLAVMIISLSSIITYLVLLSLSQVLGVFAYGIASVLILKLVAEKGLS